MHSYFYFNIFFGNLSAQQRQGEGGIYRIRGPVIVETHFLECSVCVIGRLARIMDYTRLCLNFYRLTHKGLVHCLHAVELNTLHRKSYPPYILNQV